LKKKPQYGQDVRVSAKTKHLDKQTIQTSPKTYARFAFSNPRLLGMDDYVWAFMRWLF